MGVRRSNLAEKVIRKTIGWKMMPNELKRNRAWIFNNRSTELLEHTRRDISESTVLLDVFILIPS